MAKITAVIDIGSNSVRMIVCQKSSRFAFNVIYEAKSRVRLSMGCYEDNAHLQESAMQRAIKALKDFVKIANNLKCRKILCVATSAVRDAPNKAYFINKVKKEVGLSIKVIDGKKEAYLGGIAALNLLPKQDSAITIDIGGGSTELAKIENGRIIDTVSLDIGTIRLKELFYDKNKNARELEEFIESKLKKVPSHFKDKKAIAIGGTARAISKLIMPETYPLRTLHAYTYNFKSNVKLLKNISNLEILKLKKYDIKKHRLDTFREGINIFVNIVQYLGIDEVITSGVGVREGIYLQDLLRNTHHVFPENFNPSLRSLCDRFLINKIHANSLRVNSIKIFDILKDLHKIDSKYKKELSAASKLLSIGASINYYRQNEHSFYLIVNSLNYGYTHSEKLLIAFIALYQNKKLPKESELKEYLELLPDLEIIKWLSFILALCKCLHKNLDKGQYSFKFENNTLFITATKDNNYLCQECIKELYKPYPIAIILESSSH